MRDFFPCLILLPIPRRSMWASSCVLLSCWLELELNQAGTWKDLNVRYLWMLRHMTQSEWWGCGLPDTAPPSPKVVQCLELRCECNGTGKVNVVNSVSACSHFTFTCISYLPLSFSFPHLGAALHSSRKLLPTAFATTPQLCKATGPGPAASLRMSVCPQGSVVPSLQSSPAENQACYRLETFLGEGRAMCAVPAGNLPGFGQRYRLLDALILGSRLSPFFFKEPIISCEII